MPNPRSVTIKLTEKQKEQLRRVTGEGHSEIKVEAVDTPHSGMASRSALVRRVPAVRIAARLTPKRAASKVAATRLAASKIAARMTPRSAAKLR